jgi:hypothetical protein
MLLLVKSCIFLLLKLAIIWYLSYHLLFPVFIISVMFFRNIFWSEFTCMEDEFVQPLCRNFDVSGHCHYHHHHHHHHHHHTVLGTN